MATQTLSLTTPTKGGISIGTSGSFQTMTTGAGNGSVISADNVGFFIVRNDTVGSASVTMKIKQDSIYSQRSITVPDQTITVAASDIKIWPSSSAYSSAGTITIECDAAVKLMAVRKPIID